MSETIKKMLILATIITIIVLFIWYLCRKNQPNSSVSIGYNPATIIWQSDFSVFNWMDNWANKSIGYWGMSNVSIVDDPMRGKVLKVIYPKGSASPAVSRNYGKPLGGAQWLGICNVQNKDAIYLRYYVKFGDNFQWVKGGKLPGLFGGTEISGGDKPDGTNGFSTRYMWRTYGNGEVYAYLPNSTGDYGVSLGRGKWKFTVGGWHCIEQYVKLNAPGSSNGIIKVWFNGSKVYEIINLKFRTVDTLKIEGIFFSTFFGGDDLSWVTPVDTCVYFSDFVLATSYIGK